MISTGCQKEDVIERNPNNQLNDIYATIEGSGAQRLFDSRISNDTIYFDIPFYFPEDSDVEMDLSRVILRGTIPADAIVTPALGVPLDISSPRTLTITSGTGDENNYVIVGRKVGNVQLNSAKIELVNLDGDVEEIDAIIQGSDIMFYVLPGIDVSNVSLTYLINRHSSGSITNGASINLTNPVPLTISGPGNITRNYTLKAIEPVKLNYGFGINRKLWSKTGAELQFTANMETSIAVSGDHIVVGRRLNPSKFSIYNRFNGEYVGEMRNPFGSQLSFQLVGDQNNNILATSWAPKGAKFILYRYQSAQDQNPTKLLEWTHSNPAAVTADGGVGRRVNVYGDLDGDALIMAHAGVSDVFYKWKVSGGQIVNTEPQIVTYRSRTTSTSMGFYAEGQPVSTDDNANFFAVYQGEVAYVNGATGTKISSFQPINGTVFNLSAGYATFNNAKYFAYVQYNWTYDLSRAQIVMYDVTDPSKIGMLPTSPAFSTFNVFKSEEFFGTVNANGTSDLAIGFSPDGERMQVYMMLTNGGILAHEFTKFAP